MADLSDEQKQVYRVKRDVLIGMLSDLELYWHLAESLRVLIESPYVTPNLLDTTWKAVTQAMSEVEDEDARKKLHELEVFLTTMKQKEQQDHTDELSEL